jgi:hypothetical protein
MPSPTPTPRPTVTGPHANYTGLAIGPDETPVPK